MRSLVTACRQQNPDQRPEFTDIFVMMLTRHTAPPPPTYREAVDVAAPHPNTPAVPAEVSEPMTPPVMVRPTPFATGTTPVAGTTPSAVDVATDTEHSRHSPGGPLAADEKVVHSALLGPASMVMPAAKETMLNQSPTEHTASPAYQVVQQSACRVDPQPPSPTWHTASLVCQLVVMAC